MEKATLINGNGQKYELGLPKIVILGGFNEAALKHVFENTGLDFKPMKYPAESYEAQPVGSSQIVRLFLTYNFKSRFYDNADYNNTLFLKSDHHVGFQADSICYDCCQRNHINVSGLKQGDFLSC